MSTPRKPDPVKIFAGILYHDEANVRQVLNRLQNDWGDIEHQSDSFSFRFSTYYNAEMGSVLKKQFFSFRKLKDPGLLPEMKLHTNQLETSFLIDNRRTVNIDPGYISPAKLVLATGKDYSHRLYLNHGIYGDVHLQYREGRFVPNPWTYPDYQQTVVLAFFQKVRTALLEQLRT